MMLPLQLSVLALESLGIHLTSLTRKLILLLKKTELEEFISTFLNPTCKYIENMIGNLLPYHANHVCGTLLMYILNASSEFETEFLIAGDCRMQSYFSSSLNMLLEVLSSVIHPDMTRLDIVFGREVTEEYCNFLTSFLNVALKKMKTVKTLNLEVIMPRDEPVIRMVKNLSTLEEFTFNGCNDDVLKNLSNMGAHLSKLDIRRSYNITDNSIEHILKFKSLKYLNIRETLISDMGLTELMKGMRELSRTSYWDMDAEPSNALKVFKSAFLEPHIALLPDCFPNLVSVELYLGKSVKLTALKQLKNLKMLTVSCNINPRYHFEFLLAELLNAIGKQLLELRMENVENISLKHIAETSPSLQKLCLTHCISIPRLLCGPDLQANVFSEFPSVLYFQFGIINGPGDLLKYIISRFVNVQEIVLHMPEILPVADFLDYLIQKMQLGKFESISIDGNRFKVRGQLLMVSKVNGPSMITDIRNFQYICNEILSGAIEYQDRRPDRFKYVDILT